MKLDYLRLKNFIGIKLGLGISEIEIPFYKGNNKICMILGANGSGKSTIIDNAVPQIYTTGVDRQKIIFEGCDGEKELWYTRGALKYKILIKYNWNERTKSHSAQAYIKRLDGLTEVELNPNGNVTSYKEILDVEFMLDPSFLRLCRLSQESVNITRMKTTERKTVISSLLSEVEIFSEYSKKMNDKCRIIDNNIKTLTSKLDKIGDVDDIGSKLFQIESQISAYNGSMDLLKEEININKGKLASLDLSGYKEAKELLDTANRNYSSTNTKFMKLLDQIPPSVIDEIGHDPVKLSNTIMNIKSKLFEMKSSNARLVEDIKSTRLLLEQSLFDLKKKSKELDDTESGFSIIDLENSIAIYEKELKEIDSKLDGIDVFYKTDNLLKAQDVIYNITSAIQNALQHTDSAVLEPMVRSFMCNNIGGYKKSCVHKYDTAKAIVGSYVYKKLPALNSKLGDLRAKVELKKNLAKRPSNCNIDECSFIKDALLLGDVETELAKAQAEYDDALIKYEDAKRNIDRFESISMIADSYSYIRTMIISNTSLFNSIPGSQYYTVKAFGERMLTGLIEADNDLNDYIIAASLNDRYGDIVNNIIPGIEKDLKIANKTNEVVKLITSEISKINDRVAEYQKEIDKNNSIVFDTNESISKIELLLETLSEYNDVLLQNISAQEDIKTYSAECDKYLDIREKARLLTEDINNKSKELNGYDRMCVGLNKDRDTMNFQIKLHEEYIEDKETLEKSYMVYEKIRYGLSSKTGIPLVFLKIYLEETRLIANRLLEKVANGDFRINSFDVDAKEFKIPCEVRGELVTDVSAMSGGERALMAIVLSLTLMYQASSVGSYNIISLDEMDAVLDSGNKMAFIEVLEQLMDIFEIEQVLAISHNVGFESYPVDLVLLRDYKMENTMDKTIVYKFK